MLASLNVFHYLVGPLTPPEVIAAKSGSFPLFHMQGMGTSPTASDGSSGSFVTSNWAVNFTTQTVLAAPFGFTFPNQTWNFGQFSTPIRTAPGGGAFIDATASGSCSGAICATSTPATANVKGAFLGPVGDHLGVAINAKAGSAAAQTVQIFSCAPANC
jgi:hypothetical protein